MKRGTPGLAKTKRLARHLGIPIYAAVGLLEMLWHTTVNQAPRGDIGKLEDAELAEELGWEGAHGRLIDALVAHGWLDRDPTHRLLVHDWHDHADQTLRRKLDRMKVGFCAPTTPQVPDVADASEQLADGSSMASHELANGSSDARQQLASREAMAMATAEAEAKAPLAVESPGSTPGRVGAARGPVAAGQGGRVPQGQESTPTFWQGYVTDAEIDAAMRAHPGLALDRLPFVVVWEKYRKTTPDAFTLSEILDEVRLERAEILARLVTCAKVPPEQSGFHTLRRFRRNPLEYAKAPPTLRVAPTRKAVKPEPPPEDPAAKEAREEAEARELDKFRRPDGSIDPFAIMGKRPPRQGPRVTPPRHQAAAAAGGDGG